MQQGENEGGFTQAPQQTGVAAKVRFRNLFAAMSADAKSFNGGITALAVLEGRNPQVMADQFNPDNLAKSPPTLASFLEFLEVTQGRRTINQLNFMCGLTAVPVTKDDRHGMDAMHHFLEVSRRSSEQVAAAAKALGDNNLNAEEREEQRILLDALIEAAVIFRSTL